MFKAESGSARFSSATATDAAQPGGDRANGRGSAPGDVGFVGLGRMGTVMAKNLATAGHRVIAYVRHPQQMGTLLALGLKPTTDLADLFGCEVVISMLPDDDAVREVALGQQGHKGLIAGLAPGAIHLSMSTISTAAASQLASAHARCGQGYVAAPVFGNPDAAKARQLFIVAAGAPVDVERCQPLLDQLGQRTFVVGNDPAHANLVKLMGNMLTATALEMLGETVAVDPQTRARSQSLRRTAHQHHVRRARAPDLRREDRRPGLCGGIRSAPGAQGCAPGAGRGGKRGRTDALGECGARPIADRNRARLCGSGLDRAGPDRRRRGRRTSVTLRGALSEGASFPTTHSRGFVASPVESPQYRQSRDLLRCVHARLFAGQASSADIIA
jgi:3-hydroxyisobutyrate dehydrogenase-like beta-hydroxyacid dehydrogenase